MNVSKILKISILFIFFTLYSSLTPTIKGLLNPVSKLTAISGIISAISQGNLQDIGEDYINGRYNIFNKSESVAINTKTISFYKGSTIVRQKLIGTCSIFGTIWLNGYISHESLNHEYGHNIQEKILGPRYVTRIAIPSVLYYFYDIYINGNAYDYYSTPWERIADLYGGVNRDFGYKEGSLIWGFLENFIGPIVIPFYLIFGY